MERFKNKANGKKELCNVLELPRSTFYRWLQRTEDLKEGYRRESKGCLS